MVVPMDSILEDKDLKKKHVGLQKRFQIFHVYPKCMAALLCGAAVRMGLNIPSGIGCGGKDTGRLVTWEFPLRTDSAPRKILRTVHTIYFIFQFLFSTRKFE